MPEHLELQRLIFPDPEVCQELRLYARCLRGAVYSPEARVVRLRPGGRLSFATYYGAFSSGKWRALAGIGRLFLRLDFAGAGRVSICHRRARVPPRELTSEEVPAGPIEIEVPYPDDEEGVLTAEFVASEPSVVSGGAWLTPDLPKRAVRLGIVITSFRREAAARATVRRLAAGLLSDPAIDAAVILVDNGRTLDPDDVAGATLIPNLNLGGSGGFARGLVHLQDAGGFTHAVFMDDDASTELESVRRAYQLLRFVRDDATALVSGLIYEEYPGIQLEAAGQMPAEFWMAARNGVDLRKVRSVVENEEPLRIDYGGWWMFFFPMSGVRNLPFPFFLRGDDVEFPRSNDFRLATLNGIASFGPDFFRKEAPVNIALDRRGNLVNVLLHKPMRVALRGVTHNIRLAGRLANRYCYDHVDTLAEGVRDVLRGPAAFENIAEFADGRRREIAACVRQRRVPLDEVGAGLPHLQWRRRSWLWHVVRLSLFNGHLLPRVLLRRSPGILDTVWRSPGSEVFLRPFVLVHEGLAGQVILAERDSRRYFASLGTVLWLTARLLFALPRLRRELRAARPWFGSRAYWEQQFSGGRSRADNASDLAGLRAAGSAGSESKE